MYLVYIETYNPYPLLNNGNFINYNLFHISENGVSRKAPSEHRIFASWEKRLYRLLAENVLVWCGSDGMMESFGETGRVLLRFIQRASLAISCVSSQTRFSRGSLLPFAPTDCQDWRLQSLANFRSRARKHVSSRGRKEEPVQAEKMNRWNFVRQACAEKIRNLKTFLFFLKIKINIISVSSNLKICKENQLIKIILFSVRVDLGT